VSVEERDGALMSGQLDRLEEVAVEIWEQDDLIIRMYKSSGIPHRTQ